MKKHDAERIIGEYMKPIYAFARKRTANLEDAEDLSQEIILRAFRTLVQREDIDHVEKFIWTIAHNLLSNYYRDKSKMSIGIPMDDLLEYLTVDTPDALTNLITWEMENKLHREIAYLSKLQRRIIIAYYYENKKQEVIAQELSIPLGTVKWHLFESKKELKKGVDTMRKASELKFNPIQFSMCGTNGSVGTKGGNSNFFRSALSQNIVYVVFQEEKSMNEIADLLGVSPVYIESEAEYLEEYGFLIRKGEKYLCNILIDEPTEELVQLHDEIYEKATKLFVNELYDALANSELLDSDTITGGYIEQSLGANKKDKNFILWSLIPYVIARSGEKLMKQTIKFDEVATMRPDGAQNICYASIASEGVQPIKYYDSMRKWFGPCWNARNDLMIWQIDSEWSTKRVDDTYQTRIEQDIKLLTYLKEDRSLLSKEDYAYLVEQGYMKMISNEGGNEQPIYQSIYISDIDTNKKLIAIGDEMKEKYWEEFERIKAPYIQAILKKTPRHLRKMQQFGLQYMFHSDGWFLLYCMKELVQSSRLQLPSEDQRKALMRVIVHRN